MCKQYPAMSPCMGEDDLIIMPVYFQIPNGDRIHSTEFKEFLCVRSEALIYEELRTLY
jgi:hypothetical protein